MIGTGCKTQLEPYIEQTLSDVIDMLSKSGLPCDRSDIQDLAADMVRELGLTTNFTNGRPGIEWMRLFEKRWNHCFSSRAREDNSYQRTKGLTKHNVELFFDKHQSLEDTYHFKPQNIWNCDESGFQGCKTKQKVYCARELKYAYSIEGNNLKATYTVLFCVNAAGTYLPTFTVYKGKNLWTSWTMGGRPGSMYGVSPSGWMHDINFETWFIERFVPLTKTNPDEQRLLIFDGHNSHISYKIAKCAFDNNISLLCLPPHTSHGLQPLDVACFKPAKAIWSKVCIHFFSDSHITKSYQK